MQKAKEREGDLEFLSPASSQLLGTPCGQGKGIITGVILRAPGRAGEGA